MSKETQVPSFYVGQHILFQCLLCGKVVQFNFMGQYHVSSSDHCAHCGAYYRVEWHEPVRSSLVTLFQFGEEQA